MLTDLHLHLRPDEPGTPPERYFTAENVRRYREAAERARIGELGVAEHIHRFRDALRIWSHPFWREQATDDLDSYCAFAREAGLLVGIEADYVAGAEERIAEVLDERDFDYVVGSVHFLGEAAIDQERWSVWEAAGADPDTVWARYFEQVAAAAASGLFDVIAHPDLVKVWGSGQPGPSGDRRRFYEPAVAAIAEAGVAAEISTAGLRKPVAEIYPAPELARMLAEAGVPFALSSDAHLPEQVGYAYDRAVDLLAALGVEEIVTFSGREMRAGPIG